MTVGRYPSFRLAGMENARSGHERVAVRLGRHAHNLAVKPFGPALVDGLVAIELLLVHINHPLEAEHKRVTHPESLRLNVEEAAFQPQVVMHMYSTKASATFGHRSLDDPEQHHRDGLQRQQEVAEIRSIPARMSREDAPWNG